MADLETPTEEDIAFARLPEGEVMVAKAWHFACMQENFLLNPNGRKCSSPWSRYRWSLERACMGGIPDEVSYEALESSIPIRHRERIKNAWETLKIREATLQQKLRTLKQSWEIVPEIQDDKVDTVLRAVSFEKHADMEKVLKGTIRESPYDETDPVKDWQSSEKNHRVALGDADKNYIAAYRIYVALLLEKPDPKGDDLHDTTMKEEERIVLPADHPARKTLVRQIIKLIVVDLNHQGLSMAKTYHYQLQPGKMLRKHSVEPYYMHPHRVALKMMYDVLPFLLENVDEESEGDFIALVALIGALHDLLEDANMSVEGVMTFLISRADKYDSTLEGIIQSGFVTAEEYDKGERVGNARMKNLILNLVKSDIRGKIRKALLVVTKGTEKTMDGSLKRRAVMQNVLGKKRTMELLGLTRTDIKSFGRLEIAQQSGMMERFPVSYSEKADSFLLKMNAMAKNDPRDKQLLLMVKNTDRSDNLSTTKDVEKMDAKELNKHIWTLRETVTRLIAWCMMEHDRAAYPLYNTLPRLIEITVARYKELMDMKPEMIEDCDRDYFGQLKRWEEQAPYLPLLNTGASVA